VITEAVSIVALTGGTCVGTAQARHPGPARRLLSWAIIVALVALIVLAVSGLFWEPDGVSTVAHAAAGHLMLPIVATAAGLWLGGSIRDIVRRPIRSFPRVFFLLLLCFLCLSNAWTGYLGPSRVDDPETALRFRVAHELVFPILIGIMLVVWLRRTSAAAMEVGDE
jgi:hypothetical protein